jgi:hypothetical protein
MKKTSGKIIAFGLALNVFLTCMSSSAWAFYQKPSNIKGLHVSGTGSYRTLKDLNGSQAIWNIRVDDIVSGQVGGEDYMLEENVRNGITNTVIVLNRWQTTDPDLLPVSAPVEGAEFYGFNVSTGAGKAAVKRTAEEWAQRYKDIVSNWVIGNEVNDGSRWNYLPEKEVNAYTREVAESFRIWYDAVKAANPEAHVFIPFDYRWNWYSDQGPGNFQVSDMLPVLNTLLKDTDYGIAWHAYPEDLNYPDFMGNADVNDSPDSPIINMKNLHVLTDILSQKDYLSPAGKVRHLILSEQGFSDRNGEQEQADAVALAYRKAKENPYVEGFFLNSEIDAPNGEDGNFFGLMKADGTRKLSYEAYKNAD